MYPRNITEAGKAIWDEIANSEEDMRKFQERAQDARFDGHDPKEVIFAYQVLTYQNLCTKREVVAFIGNKV